MHVFRKFVSSAIRAAKNIFTRLQLRRHNQPEAALNLVLPPDQLGSPIEESEPDHPVIHILYKKSLIGRQVLAHQIEESILENTEGFLPYEVAGRKRFATWSGISWFADRHLAVVNLYGQHLRIYKLEESYEAGERKMDLKLLHQLTEEIYFPDDVAVSPDCNLIAITHSLAQEKGSQ